MRRVFKLLGEMEPGRFIKGRGEHGESRMAWKLSLLLWQRDQHSNAEEVEASPEDTLQAEELKGMQMLPGDGMTHRFKLRPDFEAVKKSPADFTDGEAERLSRSLKAVPII